MQQYVSLSIVCAGCMLVKMSSLGGDVSMLAIGLIVLQGICSSLSSVWIEKMMKVEERPVVSDDASRQKLYWFLSDSFQMYIFGIPIYIVGSLTENVTQDTIPVSSGLAIVSVGVLQGLSLGAVFVYHSSVVRSLVAAVVIVLLALLHGVWSVQMVAGISFVIAGVFGWVYK